MYSNKEYKKKEKIFNNYINQYKNLDSNNRKKDNNSSNNKKKNTSNKN